MKIEELEEGVRRGIITEAQLRGLLAISKLNQRNTPRFDATHIAYYMGALVVMSAMGWFITNAWDQFGGWGIAFTALSYSVLFTMTGHHLWFKQNLEVPGGLLFTVAVWMVPLIVYGIEKATGFWPQNEPTSLRHYHIYINGSWILMELATVAVGLIYLKFIKFPFLTFPIAFALWYLAMDIAPILLETKTAGWDEKKQITMMFGLVMLLGTFLVDRRTLKDYAFWGYLFGLLAFWGALSSMNSNSELNKFLYFMINLFLIILSVLFRRRVFVIFGAIGVFIYLGHLSSRVFEDSFIFPIVLSAIGILIIWIGVQTRKHSDAIEKGLNEFLPEKIKGLLPPNRSR
jgi:hypothetical protein